MTTTSKISKFKCNILNWHTPKGGVLKYVYPMCKDAKHVKGSICKYCNQEITLSRDSQEKFLTNKPSNWWACDGEKSPNVEFLRNIIITEHQLRLLKGKSLHKKLRHFYTWNAYCWRHWRWQRKLDEFCHFKGYYDGHEKDPASCGAKDQVCSDVEDWATCPKCLEILEEERKEDAKKDWVLVAGPDNKYGTKVYMERKEL